MSNLCEKLKKIFEKYDCKLNHSNLDVENQKLDIDSFPHCQLDINEKNLKKCAIIIILFRANNEWNILFTIRSSQLRSYPGEICYPGGQFDSKLDKNLQDTAFRETYEEIGLKKENLELICQLCHFISPVGHYLVPFICLLKKSNLLPHSYDDTLEVFKSLKPNPKEVESIFYLPFSYILNSNFVNDRISVLRIPFKLDDSLNNFKHLLKDRINFSDGFLSRVFINFNESLFESNKMPNTPILYGINATIILFVVLTIENEANFKLLIENAYILETNSSLTQGFIRVLER
ncbi:unnamed protein product [Brachionus calyciflorus]|uniref:Nudix hydrolase domain-containing protein n=1 Tax=Brachionus calyciflorus TaxID=104777 RepID=A0A813TLA6_9BILA|nr:unnamed protein product [Brachionus calyciflorus]